MEREITFLKFKSGENTASNLPSSNWCLIILADDIQASLFNTIINDAINNDVAYICAGGKQHEFIHELADEDLAYRNAGIIKKHFPKHIVITTGNEKY